MSKTLAASLFLGAALAIPATGYAQQVVPAINPANAGNPMLGVPNPYSLSGQMPPVGSPRITPEEGMDDSIPPQNSPARNVIGSDPTNPANGMSFPLTPPPVINPINQAPVALTDKERAGQAVTHKWRNRASMPATGADGAVMFTYGATQPSIVCAPLTICLLKLEPGERVLPHGIQNGDSTRWIITPTVAGAGQTVLVIKPTDAGLRTTLGVMTDKRLYSIRLVSVQSEARSMAISEFRYPEEQEAAWREYYQQQKQEKENNTLPNGRDISQLDFNYKIGGDDVSWRPMRAYNDGVHTFIQFPNQMRSQNAPSLLTLAHDGSWFSSPTKQIVNYRKEGDTYVVDQLFDRAVLVIGVGGGKQVVTIRHKGAFK